MIRAMVVDDEGLTGDYICRLLKDAGVEVLGCYTNPYEAFDKVSILKPDILFLDIEMPEMSGLEFVERVHGSGYDCEIVFITAYNQYAIEAFTVNALDYLLKPLMMEELNRAIERVKKRRNTATNYTGKKINKKIRVTLFGNISLYVGDTGKPIHWMTLKSAELFAFMLLQKGEKIVSKWKLLEAIWPDKDREKGDINLRSTICRLNKTLRENAIEISMVSAGNGYMLETKETDMEVDVIKLEKLVLNSTQVNSQNAEYYEDVVLSYNDMLLEEFSSEWCNTYRAACHRYFLSASQKLVEYYESMDTEPLKTLNIVELLIKYEPYDEKIRESALMLHYKLGGSKGAEKYYNEYSDLLKKDLEIGPAEQVKKLYQWIMAL